MKLTNVLRVAASVVSLGVISYAAISSVLPSPAIGQSAMIQNGEMGFVVYAFGNGMARGPTSCPNGHSIGYQQIFSESPEGQRRPGETDAQFASRTQGGAFRVATVNGQNLCTHPELAPDPHYRTMDATNVVSYGIDLDGQNSRAGGRAAPGTCSHNDFAGVNGAQGVDNQMLRVVGCTGNMARTEQEQAGSALGNGDLPPYNDTAAEGNITQGGWGVVVRLRGVDNLQNDNSVDVGIYANADPIQLSPARQPIPNETYAADQDPRFRTDVHGKIVNGVLTTEPTNIRLHWVVAGLRLERPINHARVRLKFTPNGGMEGFIAGYVPVEAMYDVQYGFRNAKDDRGRPVPPGMTAGLATGGSSVMGRTCNGAYAALNRLADGDRDPQTGQCTSISAQYWIRALPAFVVDAETHSVNDTSPTAPAPH